MKISALTRLAAGLLALGLSVASLPPFPARAASTAIVLDGPAMLHQSPAEIQASLGAPVRSRTVANVLSMGFVVRTCFQCSAGKS